VGADGILMANMMNGSPLVYASVETLAGSRICGHEENNIKAGSIHSGQF